MENKKRRIPPPFPSYQRKHPTTYLNSEINLPVIQSIRRQLVSRTTPEINMEDTIGQQHIPIVTSNLYRPPPLPTAKSSLVQNNFTISGTDAPSPFHYPSIRKPEAVVRILHLYILSRATISNETRTPPLPPPKEGRNNCINYSSSLRWKTSERFGWLDHQIGRTPGQDPEPSPEQCKASKDGGRKGWWVDKDGSQLRDPRGNDLTEFSLTRASPYVHVGEGEGWNKPNGPSGANNSICSVYAST